MCGRYRLTAKERYIREHFGLDEDPAWTPRWNIAPTQTVPVIRQDKNEPKRTSALLRWGLIPSWAKDARVGYKMINARAETVAETPAFRDPFRFRRCLILADGFYEWTKQGKEKSPFCFSMADDSIFAFAGIWDRWRNPDKKWVETCSIITTSANALLSSIHDRMPVIVKPESYDLWLDPGLKKADDLLDLLKPFPAAAMRHHRVSSRVNSVKNDDPTCAEEFVPQLLF